MEYSKELEKLRQLFQNGLYRSDFYKRSLNDIHQLDGYESFTKIPFMYKQDIRNSSVEDRTNTPAGQIYGIFSSSGTTGEKTYYIYNREDKKVHEEFVKTFYSELDITENDIGGVMAPVDTGVMAHTMMWQFTTMGAGYVNCPIPSPENIIETITKVPVTVIATRPSIASGIAYNPLIQKMAKESKVSKLLMGGGFLSEERRKLLEKSWNAKCYNMFGMSEMFGPMAGECREKNGLHYLDKYLMIEIVDPKTGKPLPDGKPGVAVYTTLWEKGFPLLRYWTNDLMIRKNEVCSCGSTLPRIFYLGRLDDCYFINNRYIFPEEVENILFRYGYIGEYCVEKHGDRFLVKTEGIQTKVPPTLMKEVEQVFQSETSLEVLTPGSLNYDGHGKRFTEVTN